MVKIFSPNKKNSSTTKFIGVAGNFGKTTVSHLIYDILKQNKYSVGFLTSQECYINDKHIIKNINSINLNRRSLNKLIKQIHKAKLDFFIIEISNEKIIKKLFKNIELDSGAITNTLNFNKFDQALDFIKLIKNKGLLVTCGEEESFNEWLKNSSPKLRNEVYWYIVNTQNLKIKILILTGFFMIIIAKLE